MQCPNCKTETHHIYGAGGHSWRCNACSDSKRSTPHPSYQARPDSVTSGYSGYNMGLDTMIKDKGHWKAVAKQKGLTPLG